MGSAGANAGLGGTFFIAVFKDYLSGAIPKYKTIDGSIERLNRRTLATILIILGLIAAEDGLVGKRISCNGFKDFRKKNFVKDYCWTQGLFTNRYAYHLPPASLPAPGVVPCIRVADGILCSEEEKKNQIVYHLWYQWVPLFFFLSAAAFYAPYSITKLTILGNLSKFVDELEKPEALLGSGGSPQKVGKMMAMWCIRNLNGRYGRGFLVQYKVPFTILLSKLSFLGVSASHFWLTAKMFPIGDYYMLGLLWTRPSTDTYTHIGDVLFPKMAGCTIKKFSTTGINQESGMCNLAPNVVFQYLFLVTWWCVALINVMNALNVLASIGQLCINELVVKLYQNNLEISYDRNSEPSSLSDLYRGPTKEDTILMFAYFDLSSQMLLHKIADNVHPSIMCFGIKYLALYVKKRSEQNEGLAEFLLKQTKGMRSRGNSPTTDNNHELLSPPPPVPEEKPGPAKPKKKNKKQKDYKKLEPDETGV